tara:strand:- start:156025 stop:157362 length:1338 start_codon:yes stop_codon:yes gene_type:complete
MMDPASPQARIKQAPMGWYQYAVVALCVLAYAADGVDVVTLAYAGPVMIAEWGISPAAFGVAYTATPVGIAVGSIFLSPFADRVGRRTMTVWILGMLSVLLVATAIVHNLPLLLGLRFVTGILLGALVVTLNVTVAEFSNEKRSNFFVGVLHTGYSFGSMLCGALAALLIEPYGWRAIFWAAAVLNFSSFILAFFLLAESPDYLVARRPARALERLNATFRRMGQPEYAEMPPAPREAAPESKKRRGFSVFPKSLWLALGLLCLAGFSFTSSGAFMAGFKPQILEMAGLDMTRIGIAGMFSSGAGIIAHVSVGALARRVGEIRITIIFLLATAVAMFILASVPTGAVMALIATAALWGFFNVGSYTALILVNLNFFDATLRNTSLGIMMGFARIGGIVGPLAGGVAIGADLGRFWVLAIFGSILIIPALSAFFLAMTRRDQRIAS